MLWQILRGVRMRASGWSIQVSCESMASPTEKSADAMWNCTILCVVVSCRGGPAACALVLG
eukprot:428185-Rhodomonas_salina.2